MSEPERFEMLILGSGEAGKYLQISFLLGRQFAARPGLRYGVRRHGPRRFDRRFGRGGCVLLRRRADGGDPGPADCLSRRGPGCGLPARAGLATLTKGMFDRAADRWKKEARRASAVGTTLFESAGRSPAANASPTIAPTPMATLTPPAVALWAEGDAIPCDRRGLEPSRRRPE